MRIVAYITSYNRPEMLRQVQERLVSFGIYPKVYEDGVTFPFRGKRKFWQTWNDMLQDAKDNPADLYIFMPDDFLDIDIERIKKLHEQFRNRAYAYNIINDGRTEQWVRYQAKKIDKETMQIGFVDCGFFCNRSTLELLRFTVKEVQDKHFDRMSSSGVGMQLTIRMHSMNIPRYCPVKSLAMHGDHESQMHPEERKQNPLISK